jgi:AcrR family transcriptional regulator
MRAPASRLPAATTTGSDRPPDESSNQGDGVRPNGRYERKRDDVLAAAALVFNELGIGGGTLAGIADRVGLATNSVTYYYRRKEELVSACFLRSIDAHGRRIRRVTALPTVAQRIEACLVDNAELLADIATNAHPPLIVFSELRNLEGTQGVKLHRAYAELFRALRDLMTGPETTALGRADLNARTHLLLSALNYMRAWIGRAEPVRYRRLGARLADIVTHGMGAPGHEWSPGADTGHDWALVDEADTPGDRFLRAATGLLNEKGYHGASVDRISARLNVTKGSFYHHIRHKDDLILACFERTLVAVRRAATEAEALPVSGWLRVCAMSRALGHLQTSGKGPLLRIGALGALPATEGRADAFRRMHQMADWIGDMIVTGMMDGSIRPIDPGVAAQLLSGSINAIAELHHWVPPDDRGRLLDLYLKPVVEGVLAPPA